MDRIQKIIFISLFEFYNRLANINKTAVIYDELNDNIGSNNNCNIHCKLDGWNGCYDAFSYCAYGLAIYIYIYNRLILGIITGEKQKSISPS